MEMFEREFRGKLGLNAAESTVLTHQTPAAVVGSKKAGLSIKVRPAAISITRDSDATTTNSNNLLENNSFDGGILPSSSTKHTAEQQQRKPAAAKSIITNEQRHSNAFVVNIPVSSRRNSEYEDHTATAVVLESMEEPAEKQPISSRRPWAKSKRIQPPVGSRIQPARIQRKQEARVSQPQQQTAADKPIRLNKLPKPRDYDYNPRGIIINHILKRHNLLIYK
jgi:DNA segregation ATPase FtsK/SpoIIIE-like protein